MAQTCSALNVSDESKCQEDATSCNDLLCRFHARQCYGLYRAYKTRSDKLDALDASPPTYLAETTTALRNDTFASVVDQSTVNKLHRFLSCEHALLDRIIRARQLHHSRFYSLALDYGHKAYIDKLTNDRFVVLRALDRLDRRTAELHYSQQPWFEWVRERQEEENAARLKESEMAKKEARLFKRHWREAQVKLIRKRKVEDAKRQEVIVEEAFSQEMKDKDGQEGVGQEGVGQEGTGEEVWDPIEDAMEDERAGFVDIMRQLLWLGGSQERNADVLEQNTPSATVPEQSSTVLPGKDRENVDPTKSMSKNARKRTKAKGKAPGMSRQDEGGSTNKDSGLVKAHVNETREEMRKRLLDGVCYKTDQGVCREKMIGTPETPHATVGKVPGISVVEVEKILEEVAEIKLYLFCRLVLSQAPLLPAALRAQSVEDFLRDAQVATAELRDLCLKMEQPGLQEVRDACADFFCGGENETAEETNRSDDHEEIVVTEDLVTPKPGAVPNFRPSKLEEEVTEHKQSLRAVHLTGQPPVDFGTNMIDDGEPKDDGVRVRVCGKTIWNYSSKEVLVRGGWLHYSMITKGSTLFDAIELCRNWDEFRELNVLALFRYFPSPHWEQWCGDRSRQRLQQHGFIPYLQFDGAEEYTVRRQAAGRAQGPGAQVAVEYKNILAAHIKRKDPFSRRFVQYLAMQTTSVVLLVRDAKTGRVLVTPPEEHCWLQREKTSLGRLATTEWIVRKSVGEDLLEQMTGRQKRDWQLHFTDFYDVIVWDLQPGQPYARLCNTVQEALIKAHRIREGRDL